MVFLSFAVLIEKNLIVKITLIVKNNSLKNFFKPFQIYLRILSN